VQLTPPSNFFSFFGLTRVRQPVTYSVKRPQKKTHTKKWSITICYRRSCDFCVTISADRSHWSVTVESTRRLLNEASAEKLESSSSIMIRYNRSCDFSLKSLHCVRVFFQRIVVDQLWLDIVLVVTFHWNPYIVLGFFSTAGLHRSVTGIPTRNLLNEASVEKTWKVLDQLWLDTVGVHFLK
jgi:hypothetical protein